MEEILKQLKGGGKTVEVTVKENPIAARDVLIAQPGVIQVLDDGNKLQVQLDPSIDDTSFIAESLLHAGLKITGVKEQEMNLEEIFMRITTGAVQ